MSGRSSKRPSTPDTAEPAARRFSRSGSSVSSSRTSGSGGRDTSRGSSADTTSTAAGVPSTTRPRRVYGEHAGSSTSGHRSQSRPPLIASPAGLPARLFLARPRGFGQVRQRRQPEHLQEARRRPVEDRPADLLGAPAIRTRCRSISDRSTSPHAAPRTASSSVRSTGWRYATTASVSSAAGESLPDDRLRCSPARKSAWSGSVITRNPPATASTRNARPSRA